MTGITSCSRMRSIKLEGLLTDIILLIMNKLIFYIIIMNAVLDIIIIIDCLDTTIKKSAGKLNV